MLPIGSILCPPPSFSTAAIPAKGLIKVKAPAGVWDILYAMVARRAFLSGAAALGLGLLAPAQAQRAPALTVYMSPSCGCCGGWVRHVRENGFRVERRDLADVTPMKRQLGVPQALWSCHTALVDGYAVEGHVPATDIKRLLRERPKAIGLSAPGMPAGSPGMEQGVPQPHATVLFDSQSSRVFERH
jgi:hypothetical protein